jgi:hypothetical protein
MVDFPYYNFFYKGMKKECIKKMQLISNFLYKKDMFPFMQGHVH